MIIVGGLCVQKPIHTTPYWGTTPSAVEGHTSSASSPQRRHIYSEGFAMPRHKPERISNGIGEWLCPKCRQWFPSSGFFHNKRSANDITSYCRKCHGECSIRTRDKETTRRLQRESERRQRQKDPERFRSRERLASRRRGYTKKVQCRSLLNNAVRDGRIERPDSCSVCGTKGRIEAHHPDYEQSLRVLWLCPLCHARQQRLETADASTET